MTRQTANPNRLILQPVDARDPRTLLDESALVVASRNAFPIVARTQAKRDGFGLAAGGAVALLLGGLTFWSMSGHRAPPAPGPVAPPSVAAPASRPMPVAPAPAFAPEPRSFLAPISPVAPVPSGSSAPAPVVVFDSGGTAVQPAAASAPPAAAAAAQNRPASNLGSTENDQFASRVGDGETPVASARQLSDPSTTVTQGTLIPAVLETAIDTDLPGYARALVSRDVRSFDGSRVLIPRSSRLIGQYKSGLQAGQTRAYVIWTRLIRPDGASVALGSPGVDFSGASGLAGKVDSHFMQRFGSAALLTVIGGLSAIGNSAVVLGGGSSAASVAAQRDVSIPPTIRVPQGQPIRIFTARDLDFSTVPTTVAAR